MNERTNERVLNSQFRIMASGTQWFVDGRKLLSNDPVSKSPKRMVVQILPVAVEMFFFPEFSALKGWPSSAMSTHKCMKRVNFLHLAEP